MRGRMHIHVRLGLVHLEVIDVEQTPCSTSVTTERWLQAKDNTTPSLTVKCMGPE